MSTNKKTSSSHSQAQDMWNNLINNPIPCSNPNTDSPQSGSSSAHSSFHATSQPTGFSNYATLTTNPYSQVFYQQHPNASHFLIPQPHQFPPQQFPSQPTYYPNPWQQIPNPNFNAPNDSDDDNEKNQVDETVPETQQQPEKAKGKRKQVRWTDEEARILAERWVHCSENGVIGNNQTDQSFWSRVISDYNSLVSEARNHSQLNSKWNKIAPDVKKFNALYKHYTEIQPQSGANENDVLTAAREHFKQNEKGRKFIYEQCWNILKHYPKFFTESGVTGNKRMFRDDDEQPINLEDDNVETGTNLASNMQRLFQDDPIRRPPGRKASKSSASSDAATSSRDLKSTKLDAYETVKNASLKYQDAIDIIKENSTKKLAFKALKFLTSKIPKRISKKEKALLKNARANVVQQFTPMFPPTEAGSNEDEDDAEDEESSSE